MALDPALYVEAIRKHRQQTGADLRSAKALVDEIRKAAASNA
jgi:ribosomal protein L7/L12